jgi:hypothetical protein
MEDKAAQTILPQYQHMKARVFKRWRDSKVILVVTVSFTTCIQTCNKKKEWYRIAA